MHGISAKQSLQTRAGACDAGLTGISPAAAERPRAGHCAAYRDICHEVELANHVPKTMSPCDRVFARPYLIPALYRPIPVAVEKQAVQARRDADRAVDGLRRDVTACVLRGQVLHSFILSGRVNVRLQNPTPPRPAYMSECKT